MQTAGRTKIGMSSHSIQTPLKKNQKEINGKGKKETSKEVGSVDKGEILLGAVAMETRANNTGLC
jgi:hypothetical protein